MKFPDFIGVGVQRAATTWLHNCLSEHPQIFMPSTKEIHYFDTHFANGNGWYLSQFIGKSDEKVMGEITPNYFHADGAIERMARLLPDVKIIVIFREPCERTFSAYKLLQDQFVGKSFSQACKESSYLTGLSYYSDKLRTLYDFYSAENVKVLLYDDVKCNPYSLIKEVYSFLDVDPDYCPLSMNKVYNKIIFPKTQKLINKLGLSFFLKYIKESSLGDYIKNNYQYKTKRMSNFRKDEFFGKKMSSNVNQYDPKFFKELKKMYKDDIVNLQTLINRDLSDWLT